MVDRERSGLGGFIDEQAAEFGRLRPEGESGLLDAFRESPRQGIEQLSQMVVPGMQYDPAMPETGGLGNLLKGLLEWTPYGDVKDTWGAINPESGLDPLERSLGAMSAILLGGGVVGTIGVRRFRTVKHQRAVAEYRAQRQSIMAEASQRWSEQGQRTAELMVPMEGETLGLTSPEDIQARLEDAATEKKVQAQLFLEQDYWLQQTTGNALAKTDPRHAMKLAEAKDWGKLAAGLIDSADPLRMDSAEMGLRLLGEQLVRSDPDLYLDPSMAGDPAAIEAAQYAAAELAAVRLRALTIEGKMPDSLIEDLASGDYAEGGLAGEALADLYDLERFAQKLGVDAMGKMGPNATVAQVMRTGPGDTRMWFGMHDGAALHGSRIVNSATGEIISDNFQRAQKKVNSDTLVGMMAANILELYRSATKQAIKRGHDWYPGASRAADVIARHTGLSKRSIAGAMSALSPRTAWAPDNLLGSIHGSMIASGLDPASPEYRMVFEEAMRESGHAQDLYDESGGWRRAEIDALGQELGLDTPDATAAYYADVRNAHIHKSSGDIRDIRNLRGQAMDSNAEAFDLIIKYGLDPAVVLRAFKTNNFFHLISDPTLVDVVVTDVFHWNASMGVSFPGEPNLGATVNYLSDSLDSFRNENGDLINPITGDVSITTDVLADARAKLIDKGMDAEAADKVVKRLSNVFDMQTSRRYMATNRATLLVRDMLGLQTGHQVQAPVWAVSRYKKQEVLDALKSNDPYAYQKALRASSFDTTIAENLEGGSSVEPGSVAYLQAASGEIWTGAIPDITGNPSADGGANFGILAAPDSTGEGFIVFADLSRPGVADATRHLRPVQPAKAGEYVQMIPREPRFVSDAQLEAQRLAAGTSEYATYTPSPEGRHVPLPTEPGNQLRIRVDPRAVQSIRAHLIETGLVGEMDIYEVGVSATPSTLNNKMPADEYRNMKLSEFSDTDVSPLLKADWGTITAIGGDLTNRQLRNDLKRLGYDPIPVKGGWRNPETGKVESEASYFVPGMTVEHGYMLGEKYGQWEVGHRRGLLQTKGPNKGGFKAVNEDGYVFGNDALEAGGWSDMYLRTETKKVSGEIVERDIHAVWSADYADTVTPGPPPPETGGTEFNGTEVVVTLGDGESAMSWADTDSIIDYLRDKGDMTLYVNGSKWAPSDFHAVYEQWLEGPGGTAMVRSAYDPGQHLPNVVRAYVPRSRWAQANSTAPDVAHVSTAVTDMGDGRTLKIGETRLQLNPPRNASETWFSDLSVALQNAPEGRNPLATLKRGYAVVDIGTGTWDVHLGRSAPELSEISPAIVVWDGRGRVTEVRGMSAGEAFALKEQAKDIGANMERATLYAGEEKFSQRDFRGEPGEIPGMAPEVLEHHWPEWQDPLTQRMKDLELDIDFVMPDPTEFSARAALFMEQTWADTTALYGWDGRSNPTPGARNPRPSVATFIERIGGPIKPKVQVRYMVGNTLGADGRTVSGPGHTAAVSSRMVEMTSQGSHAAGSLRAASRGQLSRVDSSVSHVEYAMGHETGHVVYETVYDHLVEMGEGPGRLEDIVSRFYADIGERRGVRAEMGSYALEGGPSGLYAEAWTTAMYRSNIAENGRIMQFVREVVDLGRSIGAL